MRARAGEPIDNCTAADEPQNERRIKQRELVHVGSEAVGKRHDDGESHRGGADDGSADEHRLGGGLEGVARAIVGLQQMFGTLEIHVDVVVLPEFSFNPRNLLDERKLVNGLRVVGHRAVGIDGDGHWAHAKKAESHQSESKHRLGHHELSQALL